MAMSVPQRPPVRQMVSHRLDIAWVGDSASLSPSNLAIASANACRPCCSLPSRPCDGHRRRRLSCGGCHLGIAASGRDRCPDGAGGGGPPDFTRWFLGEGMALTVVGAAMGLMIASGAARLLTSQLYCIAPTDRLSCALAVAIVGVAGLAATRIPAARPFGCGPARVHDPTQSPGRAAPSLT